MPPAVYSGWVCWFSVDVVKGERADEVPGDKMTGDGIDSDEIGDDKVGNDN